jgi:hypothetical protein
MSDVFDRTEMLTTREMNTFVTGLKAGTSGRTAVALACVATMLLSACGGGGGGDTSVAAVVGTGAVTTSGSGSTAAVTTGTTTSSTSSAGTSSGTSSSSTTTTSSAVVTVPAVTAAAAPSTTAATRSIREWVTCGGTVDGAAGVARAFAAAKGGAFTVNVDCPVLIKIGSDIVKTIFIDSGVKVTFTGTGQFLIDNLFVPAFAIVNSQDIVLTNWNVQYSNSVPVDPETGGFFNNGVYVARAGMVPAANGFNDMTLRYWLINNRGITFDQSNPYWSGPIDAAAVFFFRGTTSNVEINGLKLGVPVTAGGHRYIPTAFSFNIGPRNNTVIPAVESISFDKYAVPSNIRFYNTTLDGTYMGFRGNVQNLTVDGLTSDRYGDVQDASGNYPGGIGKWFAPPHLFYLNDTRGGDARLLNANLKILNVVDLGHRAGIARDNGGSDTISGYANSIKIGGQGVVIDNYKSDRPDGLIDILPSEDFTLSNVTGSYSSEFLHSVYPAIRFPAVGYKKIRLKNILFKDVATSTAANPFAPSRDAVNNSDFIFENVKFVLNKWTAANYYGLTGQASNFLGTGLQLEFGYSFILASNNTPINIVSGVKSGASWALTATPATQKIGLNTSIDWGMQNTGICSATGGWSTETSFSGTKTSSVTSVTSGVKTYAFTCAALGISSSIDVKFVP